MEYIKHNFKAGDKLMASQLNDMENQIVAGFANMVDGSTVIDQDLSYDYYFSAVYDQEAMYFIFKSWKKFLDGTWQMSLWCPPSTITFGHAEEYTVFSESVRQPFNIVSTDSCSVLAVDDLSRDLLSKGLVVEVYGADPSQKYILIDIVFTDSFCEYTKSLDPEYPDSAFIQIVLTGRWR